MENKVRLSYAVNLEEVPSEIQVMIKKASIHLERLNSSLGEIDFVKDFSLSDLNLKAASLSLDSLMTIVQDVLLITEGYTKIQQASLATQESDPSQEDSTEKEGDLND